MQKESNHPINQLAGLVKTWRGKGLSYGTDSSDGSSVERLDVAKWLPGEFFIVCDDTLSDKDWSLQAHWVFGWNKNENHYTMHAFDNLDCSKLYVCEKPIEGTWVFSGETEQVAFTVEDTKLHMQWDIRDDKNSPWRLMCETDSTT